MAAFYYAPSLGGAQGSLSPGDFGGVLCSVPEAQVVGGQAAVF